MPEPTTEMIPALEAQQDGLARYQPANLKQLVWFAGEVAKSGMYPKTDANGNQVAMTQAETFMVMSEGIEMGISPLTAMRNIYLMEDKRGRKTTIPRADLIGARIQADPRTEEWDVNDSAAGVVTVSAKRRNRERVSMTLTLSDIPSRDRERWAKGYLDPQEMLVNRTVRRIARRHFKDMVLGLGVDQEYDETRIIDVAKVERVTGSETSPCPRCGHPMRLVPSRNGGVFSACDTCGETSSPPQAVRDAVRGVPEALTLAGPALEAGEREPEPDELDGFEAEEVMPLAGLAPDQPVETAPPSQEDTETAGAPLDEQFMEAAGIAESAVEAQKPAAPVMTRTDVDLAVQAILGALVAAKKAGREELTLAQSIVRAHGYSEGPLSAWLENHVEELPGLVAAL